MVLRGVSDDELAKRLRTQLEEDILPGDALQKAAREFNSNPQPEAAASYAQLLLRSRDRQHLSEAALILSTLARAEKDTTLLREHYYHLCIAYYLLGQYDQGLMTADHLLAIDPKSEQCRGVKALLQESYNREAAVGLAILGGAVAAGGAVLVGGLYLLGRAFSRR